MTRNVSKIIVLATRISLFGLAVCLSGCGDKKEERASTSNSQVVARLGDQVITTQELETELRFANVPAAKRKDPTIVKRVLGELVVRKYLVREAIAAKLDREPNVLLDLLRAREQVLANAFATRQASTQMQAISRSELEKFIERNPQKFSSAETMNIEQIQVPVSDATQGVVDTVKDLGSLDAIDDKLTKLGIPHQRSSATLLTAEIPSELLSIINSKKSDEIVFTRSGQNGVYFRVVGRQSRPIEGEAAVNLARQLMRIDLLKSDAVLASMSANSEAKFEGEYAKIMAQPLNQSE